ncbi:MAG: NADH-quinone oxidoreductase subunit C [Chloroflexi bacterium]|nr:NADH-quinone oxidoreductase subunit C [Chloroflexota bacterium]
MTVALSGKEIAARLAKQFPGSIIEATGNTILVKADSLPEVAAFLKNAPDLSFDYLVSLTAVDYWDYFEVVYRLTSIPRNHSLVLKVRCQGRANLHLPSVTGLWRGADFQEREVYDLFGIAFDGHPNMKRIFMWEGFQGHPLRRDYL